MLLIGSHAWDSGRKPMDYDYICSYQEYEQWIKDHKSQLKSYYPVSSDRMVAFTKDNMPYEFEIAWDEGSSADKLLQIGENTASIDTLLLLKMSHRFKKNSPHFKKTMKDIHRLRELGAKIKHPDILKLREKETYTNAHPKLNQSKEGFFDASVEYKYDHDSIHEAVKIDQEPAYTNFKDPVKEVWCSKRLFDNCPERVKLNAVIEESCVLAIERSMVPFGTLTPRQAFEMALEKVCTSITSGWFREYSWEHYYQALDNYPEDYYDKFLKALDKGIVKLFSGAY